MSIKAPTNSREYWDERFKGDWDNRGGKAQSRFFAELLIQILPTWANGLLNDGGMTVCDWGCAEGDGTYVVSKRYKKNTFYGIDFADEAIKTAKRRYANHNIHFFTRDLLNKKYDRDFDIIIASNVLEHFKEPWEVFEKLSPYARKYFIILVPYDEDEFQRHEEHVHSFTALDFLPRRAGMELLYVSAIHASELPNSCFLGDQVCAIYARGSGRSSKQFVENQIDSEMSLRSTNINLVRKIEETQVIINGLNEENARLMQLVNSKRFRVANKIADTVNRFRPKR